MIGAYVPSTLLTSSAGELLAILNKYNLEEPTEITRKKVKTRGVKKNCPKAVEIVCYPSAPTQYSILPTRKLPKSQYFEKKIL